ncbi:MAG TPA: hypothetical protein VGH02_03070 [Rhizomicrobium sp.]|jgi:hypothetical protein
MSDDWKGVVARRPLLTALGALMGIGAVGGIAFEASGLLGLPKRKSTYEDLISLLPDRDDAVTVGSAALEGDHAFQARMAAHDLRRKIGQRPLSLVLGEDAVQGRIVETGGWVLPETFAGLCALAAKAA